MDKTDRFLAKGMVLSFSCMAMIAVCDLGIRVIDLKVAHDFEASRTKPVALWKAENHCQDWDCVYAAYDKGWRP